MGGVFPCWFFADDVTQIRKVWMDFKSGPRLVTLYCTVM